MNLSFKVDHAAPTYHINRQTVDCEVAALVHIRYSGQQYIDMTKERDQAPVST